MFKRLICWLRFHDLKVLWEFRNGASKKLQCRRCKKLFGINYECKAFIPWDGELEAMYRDFYPDYLAAHPLTQSKDEAAK